MISEFFSNKGLDPMRAVYCIRTTGQLGTSVSDLVEIHTIIPENSHRSELPPSVRRYDLIVQNVPDRKPTI